MSNRVEDLETQVAELQAAVNGLTEELVEMKERVRQLEAEQADVTRDAQPAAGPEDTGPTERTTVSDAHADVVETTTAGGDATDDDDAAASDASGDGVLVAGEDDPAEAASTDDEATKTPGSQDTEDDGESGDSDIIVA